MDIVSIEFIIFAAITLLLCVVIPQRFRWIVLLIASIYFYYNVGLRALFAMLTVATFVFFLSKFIESSEQSSKKRKMICGISVVLIVLWVTLTKLFTFFELNNYLIFSFLGISYVSFSLIAYLVDVYQGKDAHEKNYLKFLLFVFFFPKITQGPISRHTNLKKDLYEGGNITYKGVCFGIQRMIYGYFKVLVIVRRASMFTTPVFDNLEAYSGSMIFLATILSALQLYCDFSGYMDIVVGFSQAVGIKLEENFKRPFFSKSAAEFWRRWHISLGEWFKDYVYTPIVMSSRVKKIGKWGRKHVGKRFGNSIMKIIALLAVWILTGLWHGTGINYIVWGLMWGIIIIISAIFDKEYKSIKKILHINDKAFDWKIFQMIRTFTIYAFGILIISVSDLYMVKKALQIIVSDFSWTNFVDGTIYSIGLDKTNLILLVFGLLLLWVISTMQEHFSVREKIAELHAPVRWFIYAASISLVLFIGIYGEGYSLEGFAYANF